MIVIGLTGSIAMGKSEVAKVIKAQGIPVFDADAEVHKLYDSSDGARLVRPDAPGAINNNRVDRAKLSNLVLADKTLLAKLEAKIHTEIAIRRNIFLKQAQSQGHDMAVIDVPLLFEKGQDSHVDVTIVVSAPPELQRQRALARPGMTPAKLDMILARQMPDHEKRQRANYVIDNSKTLAELHDQTKSLLHRIRKHHNT